MENIRRILEQENISFDDIIRCFDIVKNHGASAFIKLDGGRQLNHYTVIISFPVEAKKELLRKDGGNLKHCCIRVLELYLENA